MQFKQKCFLGKIYLTLVILLIVLIFIFSPQLINTPLNLLFQPFFYLRVNISENLGSIYPYFSSKRLLYEENIKIKKELLENKISSLEIQVLKEENDQLKKFLNIWEEDSETDICLSRVISHPPFIPYDFLLIEGKPEHLKVGNQVFFNKILIGYINETYGKTALVKLLSSSGNEVQVRILGQENILDVKAKGYGGGFFVIELPKDTKLEEKWPIVLASEPERPFSSVAKIVFKEGEAFLKVYFSYPFGFSDLDFVEIKNF